MKLEIMLSQISQTQKEKSACFLSYLEARYKAKVYMNINGGNQQEVGGGKREREVRRL
jgi:hypothetical protein